MDPRTAILDAVTGLFWHTDHHEWDQLEAVLADPARLDYTAMVGGEPADLTPSQVVAAWRPGFDAIDAHQHLVGNHLVHLDTGKATVTAAFIATHQWRGETWTLGGDYRIELSPAGQRWQVTALTMTPTWQAGNPTLIAEALAGAGPQPPRGAGLPAS
jgi:hypothetical protein